MSSLRWRLEVGMEFHGRHGPAEEGTGRLFTAFLITVDKSAREYGWGYEELVRHQQDGGITPLVVGVGHFENCINAVKRALRLMDRLKSQRGAPMADRIAQRLIKVSSDSITDARNAIEHMDEQIGTPEGPQGREAHLLAVDSDGVKLEIGRWSITFHALASTIIALHRAGNSMIESLPAANG